MRNALVSALVAAVVSAGMFFGLRAAVGSGGGGPALVDVPNLAGLKPEQARQLLDPRGLMLELTEQVDDPRYGPGTISEQRPLSSSRIARGSAIQAKLVRAGERAQVPVLVGRPESEARAMLEAVHVKVGTRSMRPDPKVPAGAVVACNPAAGVIVAPGGVVDLVISAGPAGAAAAAPPAAAPPAAAPPAAAFAAAPPAAAAAAAPPAAAAAAPPAVGAPAVVPRVTGRSLGRARELLARAGYEVGGVHKGRDEDVEHGDILRQTPAAGTRAPKGSKVDLVVNDTD